ncbi:Carbon-nitrogen hydrolase [Frigoribacterium sp. JB110]|nr:Carbon-nitrogen hydrolase [Frigoribacterium sp. JB110]
MEVGLDASDAEMFAAVTERWRRRLADVWADRPDLVVLPEHAARPLASLDPRRMLPVEQIDDFTRTYGERLQGFFAALAAEHATHLAWSGYRVDDAGLLRNSTVVYGPDGNPMGAPYDKNYPTMPEMHRNHVAPGREMVVVDTPIGRLAPTICFDLNYTEALERLAAQRPDIILFSSAYHGGFMQQYWAYTARSWFIGAIHPPNLSEAYSPVGDKVASSTNYRYHFTKRINLDYRVCHIDEHAEAFADLKNRYGRRVKIHDPGRVGVVLITSEDPDLPLAEALETAGIVDVDDYFSRSITARNQTEIKPALLERGCSPLSASLSV